MVTVVVDTNIFMHFRELREFDLRTLLDADRVEVVVVQAVVRELDDLKTTASNKKLRKRARKSAERVEEWAESTDAVTVEDGVTIRVDWTGRIDDEALRSWDLDPELADDQVVGYARGVWEQNGGDVVVLSDDVGPRLNARRLGLGTLRPPAELRLRDPASELEQRLGRTESELAALRARAPQLSCTFPSGKTVYRVLRPRTVSDAEKARRVREAMEETLKEYREVDLSNVDPQALGGVRVIRTWNGRVKNYLEKLEDYHRRRIDYEAAQASILYLSPVINNSGTAFATNCTLTLRFPEHGLLVPGRVARAGTPSPPKPPVDPRDEARRKLLDKIESFPRIVPPVPVDPHESGPEIAGPEQREVVYWVSEITHSDPQRFPSVAVWFESPDDMHSFGIEWRIVSPELPEAETGTLSVVIEEPGESGG